MTQEGSVCWTRDRRNDRDTFLELSEDRGSGEAGDPSRLQLTW